MAFLTTRMLSRPMVCSGKHLFRRCFETDSPKMPILDSSPWNQMLKNIVAYETRSPLSIREITTVQRLTQLEKNVVEIKEMMLKVMQSNQQTYTEIHHLLISITKK